MEDHRGIIRATTFERCHWMRNSLKRNAYPIYCPRTPDKQRASSLDLPPRSYRDYARKQHHTEIKGKTCLVCKIECQNRIIPETAYKRYRRLRLFRTHERDFYDSTLNAPLTGGPFPFDTLENCLVLVQSFAHFHQAFSVTFLKNIGKGNRLGNAELKGGTKKTAHVHVISRVTPFHTIDGNYVNSAIIVKFWPGNCLVWLVQFCPLSFCHQVPKKLRPFSKLGSSGHWQSL